MKALPVACLESMLPKFVFSKEIFFLKETIYRSISLIKSHIQPTLLKQTQLFSQNPVHFGLSPGQLEYMLYICTFLSDGSRRVWRQ